MTINRTVRLPKKYWRAIDLEAKRCKRSGERQLEALLSQLFGFGNVNIDVDDTGTLVKRKGLKRAAAKPRGAEQKKESRKRA